MTLDLFCYVFAPNYAFRRAALPALKERFPYGWEEIWAQTLRWQRRLRPNRPRHTLSVNMMMRQMEWNLALYRALKDHRLPLNEAGPITEEIGMKVYRPSPAFLYAVSRLRSAKRGPRVKWVLGILTGYFFSAPFIHRHRKPGEGEVVAFDVTRCPLADYFETMGSPEATPYGACNLDYGAAETFGVDLVRSQTIADGSAYCDFRWRFKGQQQRSSYRSS
ncbi:MAG: L-2-amino-thiazoline-4-carboxylic acid hydrolase [Pseudomonadota bacterium]